MPHSIIHGDACFAYFNKIWGIPSIVRVESLGAIISRRLLGGLHHQYCRI